MSENANKVCPKCKHNSHSGYKCEEMEWCDSGTCSVDEHRCLCEYDILLGRDITIAEYRDRRESQRRRK